MKIKELYAVILAGGVGERFWPLSRQNAPKQFLTVFTGEPLLLTTVNRLNGLIPDDRILIITNQAQIKKTATLFKGRKKIRIWGEPVGKNTAPAIAAAAALIEKESPHGVMAILSADHIIHPISLFQKTLSFAAEIATKENALVCLGVTPQYPHTGLGYIELGEKLTVSGKLSAARIRCFIEKPPLSKAIKFTKSGHHLWNCGIFIWQVSTLLKALSVHMPTLYRQLSGLRKSRTPQTQERHWKSFFFQAEKESIDYGVLEKADNIAAVKTSIHWNDVGSWNAYKTLFKNDLNGNLFKGQCVDISSRNTTVLSDKGIIATFGLSDLFIIKHQDNVLVIPSEKVPDLKALITAIRKSPFQDALQ